MGSQPNLASIGRKWCRFINAPKNSDGPPKNLGRKNIKFWTTFFATSALDTAYLRNETKHGQAKILASIYNVSVPYMVIYFRRLLTQKWLRSVCLFWRNIRRPLRCNHQSCDLSSYCYYNYSWYWMPAHRMKTSVSIFPDTFPRYVLQIGTIATSIERAVAVSIHYYKAQTCYKVKFINLLKVW